MQNSFPPLDRRRTFQRLDSVRPIHDRTSSAHHEGLVAQAGAVLDATFRRSLAGSPESSECNARLANAGKTELSAKAKLEFAITFANTEARKGNSCIHFENRSKTGRGYDQPLEGRDGSGLSRSWRHRPRRPRRLGIHIRSRSVELFPSSHAEKGRPVERGHGGSPAQGKSLKEGAWSLGPAPSSRLDLKNSSPY